MSQIGSNQRRLEDYRFLTGADRFIDDTAPSGTLHGLVIRSPHAHAAIEAIEADADRLGL